VTEPPFLLANDPAGSYWDDLLDDAYLMVKAYRDRGWKATVFAPEDVSPTVDAQPGLTALFADDEYRSLTEVLSREQVTITDLEYSRRSVRDAVFILLVERDRATETAVVLPLYYFIRNAEPLLEQSKVDGELSVHARPRSSAENVSFVHSDRSPFTPGADQHRQLLEGVVTVD